MKKLTCLSYFLLIIFCLGFYEKSLGMNAAFPVVISSDSRLKEIYQTNIAESPKEEIDPLVEKFVRSQLSQGGFKDQESLHMRRAKDNKWSAGFEHDKSPRIWIADHDVLKYCLTRKFSSQDYSQEKVIKKNIDLHSRTINRSIDEYLEQAAAAVQHEGGHIINKDTHMWHAAAYGFAGGALFSPFAFLCKLKKISLPLFCGITFIVPTCLSQNIVYRYSRYTELRADGAIQDNIHLLRAFKQYIKDHVFLNAEYYIENQENNTHNTHPHPEIRIKRLKKRIKALKEKGDHRAFEDPLAIKENAEMK